MLTLSIGILLGRFITHSNLHPRVVIIESINAKTMPVFISYVPDLDFTDAARRTNGFSGLLDLRAVLDADGKVSEVKPTDILPYGAADDSVAYGVTADTSVETRRIGHPTPAYIDGKFVETLPYGMTEAAIESAKQIRFTPAMKDGKPISSLVTIEYEFNLITSPDCLRCSSIITSVRDDRGVIWNKLTWRENTFYYKTHRPRPEFIK
jgi:hypothetical protein